MSGVRAAVPATYWVRDQRCDAAGDYEDNGDSTTADAFGIETDRAQYRQDADQKRRDGVQPQAWLHPWLLRRLRMLISFAGEAPQSDLVRTHTARSDTRPAVTPNTPARPRLNAMPQSSG